MSDKYILDEHGNPQLIEDIETWARWFEGSLEQRQVGFSRILDVQISTVFLGIDHAMPGINTGPVLWETLVKGGVHDGMDVRYQSYEDAVHGHTLMIEAVLASMNPEMEA